MSDNLNAGFTGKPAEPDTSIVGKAKSVASKVKQEAGSAAAAVQDHPTTAGSALLLAGLLGAAIGYAIATASPQDKRRSWY